MEIKNIRQPVVSGSFYPSNPVQLKSQLAVFFQTVEQPDSFENVAAIIVPHAGYVYSGEIAASAFAKIDPAETYSRIFLIGTSHHVYLKGASVNKQGFYSTPFGNVEVDTNLANLLIRDNNVFEYEQGAHNKEHSIEVQLPFLQYHLKKPFKIVPIIIGTQSEAACKKIAEALIPYFNRENLFVISSDFSHYPGYSGAVVADKNLADAISSNSPEKFLKARKDNDSKKIPGLVTSCCGWSSILTLLYLSSKSPGMIVNHIQYKNSGDLVYGDKSRVVGYHSFAFTRKNEKSEAVGFSLSVEDKIQLLKLARTTIETQLQNQSSTQADDIQFSEALKTPCGAFVTLKKGGQLRGCIGRLKVTEPLYKIVRQMATASAFQDTRFQPVGLPEMKDIEIEISVLTPLKRIERIDEFQLGKHGIYMIKGYNSGTFLPQVATDTGWSRDELLGHCARDKAGIGWDGWEDAELYTYEALVFSEKELLKTK